MMQYLFMVCKNDKFDIIGENLLNIVYNALYFGRACHGVAFVENFPHSSLSIVFGLVHHYGGIILSYPFFGQ